MPCDNHGPTNDKTKERNGIVHDTSSTQGFSVPCDNHGPTNDKTKERNRNVHDTEMDDFT